MRLDTRYRYLIDDLAQAELDAVGGTYISYFAKFGDPAKGRAWANRFYAEYRDCIDDLKANPYRYPVCNVYPFDVMDTEYRAFTVGWFTVFYTISESDQSFIVWHIRSSRSDFSKLRQK